LIAQSNHDLSDQSSEYFDAQTLRRLDWKLRRFFNVPLNEF